MIKKFIFGVFLTLGIAGLSSCVSDEPGASTNIEGDVITVMLPNGMGSRAVGDNPTPNKLQYAVYDAEGKQIESKTITNAFANDTKSESIKLNLVRGFDYKIVFFASDANATRKSFQFSANSNAAKITSSTSGAYLRAAVNDPSTDVFSKVEEVKGGEIANKSIVLTRPIGQLNFVTNDADNKYVKELDPQFIKLKFNATQGSMLSEVNLLDNTTKNFAASASTLNYYPNGTQFAPVASSVAALQGYDNIFSVFILAPSAADESLIIDGKFEISYEPENEQKKILNTIQLSNLPIKANMRTNVYGSLLTANTNFDVTVSEIFNDDFNRNESPEWVEVSDIAGLQQALAIGNSAKLQNDIDLSEVGDIAIKSNFAIDLGNHKLTLSELQVKVESTATLTINGDNNGTIESPMFPFTVYGKMIVNGGNFVNTSMVDSPYAQDSPVIDAREGSEVEINGGTFSSVGDFVVRSLNGKSLSINEAVIKSDNNFNYAVFVNGTKDVTIDNTTIIGGFGGLRIANDANTLATISNSNLIQTSAGGQHSLVVIQENLQTAATGATVTVNNCNMYSSSKNGLTINASGENQNIVVNGGLYNKKFNVNYLGSGKTFGDVNTSLSIGGNDYTFSYEVK